MELLFKILDSITILFLIYMTFRFISHREKTNKRLDELETKMKDKEIYTYRIKGSELVSLLDRMDKGEMIETIYKKKEK